jgi:hypothetical protein
MQDLSQRAMEEYDLRDKQGIGDMCLSLLGHRKIPRVLQAIIREPSPQRGNLGASKRHKVVEQPI